MPLRPEHWSARARSGVAAILGGLVLISACEADLPASRSPAGSMPPTASSRPTPSATPPAKATASAPLPSAPAGLVLPEPGLPFEPGILLDAMRTSRRPGGVPDRLETEHTAKALAAAIWTFGGDPWTTMAFGGSCGPDTCTLEAAGTRPDTLGEDLWVFEIDPASGRVSVVAATLAALPTQLKDPVDGLARNLSGPDRLAGLVLASVLWLPPPDGGQLVVSYRSGGEEGSCGVDLTIDATVPAVTDERPMGC